jgi:hypothetical protein
MSDVGGYALGALDEREAAAFEEHLDGCPACRDELGALIAVTERLALAVPQFAPPPRLRRAVLSAVRPSRDRRPVVRRVAAVAVALTALVLVLTSHFGPLQAHHRALTVTARVIGSHGHAELRLAGGHAELVISGMPQPPAGEVYEVWRVGRGGGPPRPTTALFGVTTAGDGVVAVPGGLRALAEVLVTAEPAGGTDAPTSPAVIEARLG